MLVEKKKYSPDRVIRYIGQGDQTGYGIAAASLVRGMIRCGVDVVWEPLCGGANGYERDPTGVGGPEDLIPFRNDERRCSRVILHTVPEYYAGLVARERHSQNNNVKIWGSTVWETDKIPRHWPALFESLDGLIVPTAWNLEVFRASGVTIPIAVIPHINQFDDVAVDDGSRESSRSRLPELKGRYVFYCISTWMKRKGIDLLIRAFTKAFKHSDPVVLILKTTDHDLEQGKDSILSHFRQKEPMPTVEKLAGMMPKFRKSPLVIHLGGELSDQEIAALHDMGDCYVSLCRAEGWGLGAFEAGFREKPVIMTGWGGQTDFLKPENSYLVDWEKIPVKTPVKIMSYTSDQQWVEPSIPSAIAALREVFSNQTEAKVRGAMLKLDIQDRFSCERTVSQLVSALW